jgi:hypothetical protein
VQSSITGDGLARMHASEFGGQHGIHNQDLGLCRYNRNRFPPVPKRDGNTQAAHIPAMTSASGKCRLRTLYLP